MGITKQRSSVSEKTTSANVGPWLMDPAMASSSHMCLFGKQKEKKTPPGRTGKLGEEIEGQLRFANRVVVGPGWWWGSCDAQSSR